MIWLKLEVNHLSEIMWEGFKLVIWWQWSRDQHDEGTKTTTKTMMSLLMMMFGFGELWGPIDTRCEPSCLSHISPRDSERPSRPLVESTRVQFNTFTKYVQFILHLPRRLGETLPVLHCSVVLNSEVSAVLCAAIGIGSLAGSVVAAVHCVGVTKVGCPRVNYGIPSPR